ncbi:hypothetical protein C8R46DRAFT_651102 [Mycena filopes]|nr:hypothetical protein C8R46DRAFT_651102 [Mycena filopes]
MICLSQFGSPANLSNPIIGVLSLLASTIEFFLMVASSETITVDGKLPQIYLLIKRARFAPGPLNRSRPSSFLRVTPQRSVMANAPAVPTNQPFPIAAAVAAGMVLFLVVLIIIVFSISQNRRGAPVNYVRGSPPRGLDVRIPPGHASCTEFESRADGSTISISSPV